MIPIVSKQPQFHVYLNYTYSTLHNTAEHVATSTAQLSYINTQGTWTVNEPSISQINCPNYLSVPVT